MRLARGVPSATCESRVVLAESAADAVTLVAGFLPLLESCDGRASRRRAAPHRCVHPQLTRAQCQFLAAKIVTACRRPEPWRGSPPPRRRRAGGRSHEPPAEARPRRRLPRPQWRTPRAPLDRSPRPSASLRSASRHSATARRESCDSGYRSPFDCRYIRVVPRSLGPGWTLERSTGRPRSLTVNCSHGGTKHGPRLDPE